MAKFKLPSAKTTSQKDYSPYSPNVKVDRQMGIKLRPSKVKTQHG